MTINFGGFMKISNNFCLIVAFSFISSSLFGMQLTHDQAVKYWKDIWSNNRWSIKTDLELHEIVENRLGKFDRAHEEAASELLNERAGLMDRISGPLGGYTPEQQWNQRDPQQINSSAHAQVSSYSSWFSNNVKFGLEVAAALAVVWAAAEACIAYKNLPVEEWNHAKGISQKSALLAAKTSAAMGSRPGQAMALGRDVINKVLNR